MTDSRGGLGSAGTAYESTIVSAVFFYIVGSEDAGRPRFGFGLWTEVCPQSVSVMAETDGSANST